MSSDDIAIRVTNLSKCYEIYDTPRDRLKQFVMPRLMRITRKASKQYFKEYWALNDVSFEIQKGETVGIIGRNGSGKSTLLQMICGTLNPTRGYIQTYGRVAALLELGSGFNPEFTGRENVYMNASVLGLSTRKIDEKFDEIADFSGIGDFIEQPVKTYSSGMVVRLAFAVSINVDPEILIVDEALSVGDELFQRKCFSRIEAIRTSGSTILFVSHSAGVIVELCDRAVLLDAGEKLAVGEPKQIVGHYHKLLYAPDARRNLIREKIRRMHEDASDQSDVIDKLTPGEPPPDTHPPPGQQESFDPNFKSDSTIAYENQGAVIGALELLTLSGEMVNGIVAGRRYRYRYKVVFDETIANVRFGMLIKSISGVALGGAYSAPTIDEAIPLVEAGKSVTVDFTFNCYLNPGVYFLNAGALGYRGQEEIFLDRRVDAVVFRVLPQESNMSTEFINFSVESNFSIN